MAETRWHYSWPIAYAFGVIREFGFASACRLRRKGHAAAIRFDRRDCRALFCDPRIACVLARTTIRFSAKVGSHGRNHLVPWQRYRVDLAEIKGFQAMHHEAQGHTDVGVELVSGVVQPLPIDWQPPAVVESPRKRIFVAPVSNAAWMANALTELLEAARLLGHDTYRS